TGRSWRDTIKDLARRGGGSNWSPKGAERATRLSRNLPKLGDYLPRRPPPTFGEPRVPAPPPPPPLSPPGLPPKSPFSAVSSGKALLWLLLGGMLILLLWRSAGWYVRHRAEQAGTWRLGPWPVRPAAVRTRGELVRAFEYLALLVLGRPA